MIDTWIHSDILATEPFNGDLSAALGAIQVPTIVMPSTTDLYFTLTDSEIETAIMPDAELRPIVSD